MPDIPNRLRSPWLTPGSRRATAAIGFVVLATISGSSAVSAKPVKKPVAPPKKPVISQTKGQGQLNGGDGKFGVIYTLKNGVNFEILSAAYQITPFACYSKPYSNEKEKFLVVTMAVKNVLKDDNYIGDWGGMVSAFSEKGKKFDLGSGCSSLESLGDDSFSPTLKPGQGYGQPAMNNPVKFEIPVDADAHVVKLMLNVGRAGTSEDVVRYFLSEATTDNAGGVGDPRNVVTGLPDGQHDPADKTGSVVPTELSGGKPGAGTIAYSGFYGVKLDSFVLAADNVQFGGNPADDGKRWAIATLIISNTAKHDVTLYEAQDTGTISLTDSDGENYTVWGTRKAKADEEPASDHVIKPGDNYTVREIFMVPKTASLTKYLYTAVYGHRWAFDITGVK